MYYKYRKNNCYKFFETHNSKSFCDNRATDSTEKYLYLRKKLLIYESMEQAIQCKLMGLKCLFGSGFILGWMLDPTKTRAKWMTFLSPLFRCVHLPSQPASFAWWHLSSSEVGATVTFPDGTLWSFSPKVIFVLLTCADCREISIYISMSLISVSGTR